MDMSPAIALTSRNGNIQKVPVIYKATCQEYSMKYIYSTSQMSKLSLTLCTFSITGSVAGLFLTLLVFAFSSAFLRDEKPEHS